MLGPSKAYENDPDKRHFMRDLMALPIFPAAHAPKGFDFLVALNSYPSLQHLVTYVRRTWFFHSTFTPSSRPVFGRTVWTLSDAEGWRRRLRGAAGWRAGLPFYPL